MAVLRSVRGNWDAVLAVLSGVVFVLITLSNPRPLIDERAFLIAGMPYGAAIVAAAIATGRWLSDRMKDSIYGEVVRVLDPDESRLHRPVFVVVLAGVATSLLALLLFVTYGESPRTAAVWSYGLMLAVAIYATLGLLDVYFQSRRHQRRSSLMQRTSEEEDRRRRSTD